MPKFANLGIESTIWRTSNFRGQCHGVSSMDINEFPSGRARRPDEEGLKHVSRRVRSGTSFARAGDQIRFDVFPRVAVSGSCR